ncbi:MAG: protease SohB [Gammaproteobacteria bacterium]|nr:MAG: protease SohB [Pseudomonadota bacterium]PIE38990.1 MAG: protease SohB [Gammaproteobacteria bacterium]
MSRTAQGYLQIRGVNQIYANMVRTFAQNGVRSQAGFTLFDLIERFRQKNAVRPNLFILSFLGDTHASGVEALAREISAIIEVAGPEDEVLLKLESPGGAVHAYGLASSELERLKAANIKLTICIDRVAASGGYMMACIADRIVAAPLAIVGSIGVIAEVPNIHRLLNKVGIEFEQVVAGDEKQPLSLFTRNTSEGREKFQENVVRTHELFREHVKMHRSIDDFDTVSNGNIYYGKEALARKLVDELGTSEAVITAFCKTHNAFEVKWVEAESWAEKLGMIAGLSGSAMLRHVSGQLSRFQSGRF